MLYDSGVFYKRKRCDSGISKFMHLKAFLKVALGISETWGIIFTERTTRQAYLAYFYSHCRLIDYWQIELHRCSENFVYVLVIVIFLC